MMRNFGLSKYHATFLNLKRLQGLPFSRKIRYMVSAFCGETCRVRTFGTWGLRLVEINLTNRCQCRCLHCYAMDTPEGSVENELSTDEVMRLIDDIEKMGATEIILTGGEPLLRGDILELVEYGHSRGLVVRLITNGILLDESLVRKLKNSGLNWCSISIDSSDPAVHDRFRNYPGCFEKAMDGFLMLNKYKIPSSMISVARKELIYSGDLEKIVSMAKKIGASVVRINFPVPIGRYQNQTDQILSFNEREQVRSLLDSGFVSMESPKERTRCTAAVTKIHILPNGDVTPCVFTPLTFGNIRDRKLIDIWKSMDGFIKEYKKSGQCPVCDPLLRKKLFDAAENQKSGSSF